MNVNDSPKLGKLLVWSIIILILQIVAVIIHVIGWVPSPTYIISRTSMVVLAALLVASAIAAPYFIEKQKYVPLIIGLMIAVLSAVLIIYTLEPLINDIRIIATIHLAPIYLGLYIVLIVIYSVSIALCVIIIVRGIRLIIDYTRQSA